MPQDYYDGNECWEVAERFNFNLGNAIKYIWRAGRKPEQSALSDLKKAEDYIGREILRLTEERDGDAE